MRNEVGSHKLLMAALTGSAILVTASCKPEPSSAYNPQLDGLVYQQPSQPDLSYLGDQKTLHPVSIHTTAAPSDAAPEAPASTVPATAASTTPAATSTETAPATPAPETAPATTAPAAPTTDTVTPPPG